MDNQSDLAKAEAELATIDGQIAALEQRRAKLRAFIDLGRSLFGTPAGDRQVRTPLLENDPQPRPRNRLGTELRVLVERDRSMKAQVLAMSAALILTHGPLTTAKLVELIEAEGVQITGKDKNITDSVMLSRSPDFVSDRIRGWSLTAEKTPADAATSPGSSAA